VARMGIDVMVVDPGTDPQVKVCGVCHYDLIITARNQPTARSWGDAVAGHRTPSDVWKCPNIDTDWHQRAASVLSESERTSSTSLKKMLITDVEGIVGSQNANYPMEPN